MAVKWIEPQMVFEISFQAMTHQQHFDKMQVDSFAKTGVFFLIYIFAVTLLPPHLCGSNMLKSETIFVFFFQKNIALYSYPIP